MVISTAERNRIAVNLWTAKIIPIVLAGVVGYATWVLVVLLCVKYLLVKHENASAAIPILVVYFILFALMAATFLRLVQVTVWDPPYVPLGASVRRSGGHMRLEGTRRFRDGGISGGEYDAGGSSEGTLTDTTGARENLDSPGLELFYTKNIFICGVDGRPKWCSECANWKPDRAHHCSDAGRCIRKMDHFCPWVGGPVGENNFKFFIQFTSYTALYCMHLLIVMVIYLHKQTIKEGESINPHFAAIIGLAGFFGMFTAGMTITSLDLALRNLTQVEKLALDTKIHSLAILKPSKKELCRINPYMESHLSYPEINYPLEGNGTNHVPGPTAKYYAQNGLEIAIPEEYQNQNIVRSNDIASNAAMVENDTQLPVQNSGRRNIRIPNEVLARLHAAGAQLISSELPSHELLSQQSVAVNENGGHRGAREARDRLATRTFAILKMEEGNNPWDLGSRLLNLQSVMGTNICDYLLPIKRSPCCNHEDPESHFQVGPQVDLLKVHVFFKEPKDVQLRNARVASSHSKNPSAEDLEKQIGHRNRKGRRRRRRRRRSYGSQSEMDDLAVKKKPPFEHGQYPVVMSNMGRGSNNMASSSQ